MMQWPVIVIADVFRHNGWLIISNIFVEYYIMLSYKNECLAQFVLDFNMIHSKNKKYWPQVLTQIEHFFNFDLYFAFADYWINKLNSEFLNDWIHITKSIMDLFDIIIIFPDYFSRICISYIDVTVRNYYHSRHRHRHYTL